MNWRFWKKICANNSMEDDKQVSLTPALLNRDSESDKKQYRSVLNLARKLEEKDILNMALSTILCNRKLQDSGFTLESFFQI